MSQQPREFDAVLGGNNAPPVTGAVLGGIEGVKRRLESEIVDVRIKALSDALNYQEAGLNLVIEALEDDSLQVKGFASRLLKKFGGEKGKQALLEFDPYLYFTKLEDWEVEEFDYEVGITNPGTKGYALDLRWASKKFKIFLNASENLQVQALHCYYPSHFFLDAFIEAKENFSNLKALFWGDPQDHPYKKTSRHELTRNMSLILENYPNLEVFHIRGRAGGDPYWRSKLSFTSMQHDYLKTLVIETRYLPESTTEQITKLELPNLEYLELWFGNGEFDAENLIPKIAEKFPKLKYLGIRSYEYTDYIALVLATVDSPLIERLKILDLSMGTMTNEGIEYLLNCPDINQIHTLDVSMNYISDTTALEQFACNVITQPQDSGYDYGDRYLALHE